MPEELEQLYKNYIDSFNIYQENYINWLKETKGKIFKLKNIPSFHTNDGLNGDSNTIFFDGYCKIIGEYENTERPIVRLMHMDLCVSENVFYPEDKMLNRTRYYVNAHNFTGYTYSSLMDIIDKPLNESEIIPFVKDIMNDDNELVGYMISGESIKNNIKYWLNETN